MSILPAQKSEEQPGDWARRRAHFGLAVLAVSAITCWGLFTQPQMVWDQIMRLPNVLYWPVAALVAMVMALAPLGVLIGLVWAVWFGVEGVYLPHRAKTPQQDKMVIGLCRLIWFSPALAMLSLIVRAIWTGRVHFSQPPRNYEWATDPVPYLQSLGFLTMGAASFAFLAWKYWKAKGPIPEQTREQQ